MRKVSIALLGAILALGVALAAPAGAAAITVSAGFALTTADGGWCTVSFPDPQTPNIVYTAGHCYRGGDKNVSLGSLGLGKFIPEIRNPKVDLIAIRLNSDIPSEYSLMSGDPLLSPWIPHKGNKVCKWGATTLETCGEVLSVEEDSFTVRMPADHGDSGAPIYTRLSETSEGVHILGTVISSDKKRPGVIHCTRITSINSYLSKVWGPDWKMG